MEQAKAWPIADTKPIPDVTLTNYLSGWQTLCRDEDPLVLAYATSQGMAHWRYEAQS